MHGFGIKNIENTAEKYNGTLKNEFVNGEFISVAMVVNETK